ncbi:MAG: hypothetical protein ACE5J3_04620 [Methanosarcinales archaeon]
MARGSMGIEGVFRSALKDIFYPILKEEKLDVSVTANTDIFSSDISVDSNGFLIFQFITDTAGYPIIKNKVYGSGAYQSAGLNESSNLTASSWYEFWFTVRSGDSVNVQFSANATSFTVRVFFVETS